MLSVRDTLTLPAEGLSSVCTPHLLVCGGDFYSTEHLASALYMDIPSPDGASLA
jgi:hypothetical protein